MKQIFKINRKYENKQREIVRPRKTRRRRRLGRALDFYNGGKPLTFYLNLIFR